MAQGAPNMRLVEKPCDQAGAKPHFLHAALGQQRKSPLPLPPNGLGTAGQFQKVGQQVAFVPVEGHGAAAGSQVTAWAWNLTPKALATVSTVAKLRLPLAKSAR
jgi:hypothetical protein